jgi:hypothetical protein
MLMLKHANPPLDASEVDMILSKDVLCSEAVISTIMSTRAALTLPQCIRIMQLTQSSETLEALLQRPDVAPLIFTPEFSSCLLQEKSQLISSKAGLALLEHPEVTFEFILAYFKNKALIRPLTDWKTKEQLIQVIMQFKAQLTSPSAIGNADLVEVFASFVLTYHYDLREALTPAIPSLVRLFINNAGNASATQVLRCFAGEYRRPYLNALSELPPPLPNALEDEGFSALLKEIRSYRYETKPDEFKTMIAFFIRNIDSDDKKRAFFSYIEEILGSRSTTDTTFTQLFDIIQSPEELIHFTAAAIGKSYAPHDISDENIARIFKHPACTLDVFLTLQHKFPQNKQAQVLMYLEHIKSLGTPEENNVLVMKYCSNNLNPNVHLICTQLSPNLEVLKILIKESYSESDYQAILESVEQNGLDLRNLCHDFAQHCREEKILSQLMPQFYAEPGFLDELIQSASSPKTYLQETLQYPLSAESITGIIDLFDKAYRREDKLSEAHLLQLVQQESMDDRLCLKLLKSNHPMTEAIIRVIVDREDLGHDLELQAALSKNTIYQDIQDGIDSRPGF